MSRDTTTIGTILLVVLKGLGPKLTRCRKSALLFVSIVCRETSENFTPRPRNNKTFREGTERIRSNEINM